MGGVIQSRFEPWIIKVRRWNSAPSVIAIVNGDPPVSNKAPLHQKTTAGAFELADFDDGLIDRYRRILDEKPPAGRQKEQVVQDFLEQHTRFIPTPNLLNHQLHFETILSKFALDTDHIPDYCYITRSSGLWRIILVELESPDKPIFNKDEENPVFSSKFHEAVAQVQSWKSLIEDSKAAVTERFTPLMAPLDHPKNPVEFKYQLIIGRSANKNKNFQRKQAFLRKSVETQIDIFTYDQLIDYHCTEKPKLVMRRTKNDKFEFKYMHFHPNKIFARIGPDTLILRSDQKRELIKAGYEIQKWEKNDLLTFSNKLADSTGRELELELLGDYPFIQTD